MGISWQWSSAYIAFRELLCSCMSQSLEGIFGRGAREIRGIQMFQCLSRMYAEALAHLRRRAFALTTLCTSPYSTAVAE